MKRGLVVGKFYPPHLGHSYLIETGAAAVDDLVVVVCDREGQTIPAELRADWLRTMHPDVTVIVVPDIEVDDDSELWAGYTKLFLGYVPDVVFTSEDYGYTYAQELGSEHVQVDRARVHIPISATMVRKNPFAVWEYLHPCVREYFVKRICIVGAESTGTTTLAQDLAKHYETLWVPEYGRLYSEAKQFADAHGASWESTEFVHIAEAQSAMEDTLATCANKLLICDTNAFATMLWHERYMDAANDIVEKIASQRKQLYDLYIVTGDEIPFVQDGLRDGEAIRHQMHESFELRVADQDIPYYVLRGSREERKREAIAVCDELLASSCISN